MKTEEKVRDVASAQMLKAEHEQLKAEIEAREGTFGTIVNAGEEMIDGGHYAHEEVSIPTMSVNLFIQFCILISHCCMVICFFFFSFFFVLLWDSKFNK